MVLGLKFGKYQTDGSRYGNETETTYRLVSELADQVQRAQWFHYLRELIGYDLSDPEQRAEVVKLGLFKSSCGKFIRDAVDILESDLMKFEPTPNR